MTDKFTHIGEVISYIRKQQNISQAELADGICSREYIGQIEKSIEYCLEGIHYHYPNFNFSKSFDSYRLSNIEIVLLQCLFNQYYRIGDSELSLIGKKHLFSYLHQKLDTSEYIVHKRLHFELMGLAILTHNIFINGQNSLLCKELLSMVTTSISLLKKYGYSENLPELLFDRTYLYYKLEDTAAYEASLSEAISISNFFVGEEETNKLIDWLNKKIA